MPENINLTPLLKYFIRITVIEYIWFLCVYDD